MSHTSLRHARRTFARAGVALALSGGLLAGTGLPVQTAPTAAAASSTASGVISTASSLVGTPYVYGGTTPGGFDCSGFTQYVLAQHGISVPRTAHSQMGATARISAGEATPGDLVFFVSGGRAYHVGIYAGDGRIYDAGRSGGTVKHRSIWTSSVVYGNVV